MNIRIKQKKWKESCTWYNAPSVGISDEQIVSSIIKEFESIPPDIEKYEREMEELRNNGKV